MKSAPATAAPPVHSMHIHKEISIDAPASVVFQTILEQIGPDSRMHDGKPFPFKIEPWPGGRWYRDLGNDSGHLWGHVQVIKPPTLLELTGPLCMSYAAANHVQYRLTEKDGSTLLTLTHTAIGHLIPEHRDGMPDGWGELLDMIRKAAEQKRPHR